jgi:hypothetical protein
MPRAMGETDREEVGASDVLIWLVSLVVEEAAFLLVAGCRVATR